ncbi:MAG: TetR/AcrR family transcriptional regulator [Parvularculaceae bacterium]|nr:TetR/AcrR family transcriptional regulator [Parvularculaceae bacterium]
MSVSSLSRSKPQQARAAKTRQALLQAAEHLLAEHPPEAIKARQLAAKAEVPVGSLYRYFANIDELFSALLDDFNQSTLDALVTAPSKDWRADVRTVMQAIEAIHQRHPIYGVLMTYLPKGGQSEGAIAIALRSRLSDPALDLSALDVDGIATTVTALIEGVEREYHRLEEPGCSRLFAEASRAIEAYLATYLEH